MPILIQSEATQSKSSPMPQGESASLAGAAGSISAATMISRLLAMGREMVMSKYFGAGYYTDAFNVAFRVPNLLRDLFAEGALSSAFIPTYVRTMTQMGKEEAWCLANRVINALAIILAAVTLLIYFGASWLVYLLAAGSTAIPGKFELTVQMTRIMSPFLLCVALAAATMGMLNAHGRFFMPALAPAAFNVCSILAGIFLSPYMPRFGLEPVVSMAVGALAGGISQFAIQVPSAYRTGFRFRPLLNFTDPGMRQVSRLMLPAIVGISATQINIVVDTQLAIHYGNGPVSYLNYAFRLIQLPIGLFGVAIATSTLATVSFLAAQNNVAKLQDTISSSLRLAACLTFPASVGLILFRREIVGLLYQRGLFIASDTEKTSEVLLLYALALFAYSAVKILVPAFYALKDTKTPVRLSLVTVGVKVMLNFLFVMPQAFGLPLPAMGFLGLALATSLASWLNLILLAARFAKRTATPWHPGGLAVYGRIAVASLMMGACALLTFGSTQAMLPMHGTLGLALPLGFAILIGMMVILPILRWFKVEEEKELSTIVLRLMRRVL